MKDGSTNWLRLVKSHQPTRASAPEDILREAEKNGATVIVCIVTKAGKPQARPMDVGIMGQNPELLRLAWEIEQQRHEGLQPPKWYVLRWREKGIG